MTDATLPQRAIAHINSTSDLLTEAQQIAIAEVLTPVQTMVVELADQNMMLGTFALETLRRPESEWDEEVEENPRSILWDIAIKAGLLVTGDGETYELNPFLADLAVEKQAEEARGNNAVISNCLQYRYFLCRELNQLPGIGFGDSSILFVMLNPSTADASTNDPTLKKCMKFATTWGHSRLEVANLYAYRATQPSRLKKVGAATAVGPDNDAWLRRLLRKHDEVICAWGKNPSDARVREFIALAESCNCELLCIDTNDDRSPRHPLYIKDDETPKPWNPPRKYTDGN